MVVEQWWLGNELEMVGDEVETVGSGGW